MKTNVHCSSYLAQFFLKWKMFQNKFVNKIKILISCSLKFYYSKFVPLWDNVVKCCRTVQVTEENIAFLITKARNTHSEYAMPIAFSLQRSLCESFPMLHYSCYLSCSPYFYISVLKQLKMISFWSKHVAYKIIIIINGCVWTKLYLLMWLQEVNFIKNESLEF